jgi:signal transduction histidine kinase
MSPPSDTRRWERCHALRGGPAVELGEGVARSRRLMVLVFQVAVIGLLAARGYPIPRLLFHGGVALFYLAVCRYPTASSSTRAAKIRVLLGALLSYGAWMANTGGLASPLIALGVGILSPAALVLETRRARLLFAGAALGLLVALAFLSLTPMGALLAPLAPRDGRASPQYLVIAGASVVITARLVSLFWARMTADYDRVAVELGTRREELCSESEDRTREIEGAAARLAHELKNPLASIKCLSTHMARGHLDPKTAQRLAVVAEEADRLTAIVDGFLSLSRGLGELTVVSTRPFEIARELKLLLDIRAREAGVTLEVAGSPEAEVHADSRKIRRVLFHLVVNAVQASTSGQTVTIDVGPACPVTGKTSIKVIDHGEGMSPEVLERVKRPYYTTREGGTGLGIAVARALVEQHGGQLVFASTPGRGTAVTIELPRSPPPGEMLLDNLRGRPEAH